MTNKYKRKKQPKKIRVAILEQTTNLLIDNGLNAITIQKVADAVGITKGGVSHHFLNKKNLISTVFTDLLIQIDHKIDCLIADDPIIYGSFTRAYINVVFDMSINNNIGALAQLSISSITDESSRKLWSDWFAQRLKRHTESDGDLKLCVIRLATDGAWLADLSNIPLPNHEKLRNNLLNGTNP